MDNGYTDLQLDVLKELINIGGGNAATSISQLIEQPVNMLVPLIEILPYDVLYDQIMSEDEPVYAIINQVFGDARGVFLFSMTNKSASQITQMMIPDDISLTDDLKESAVKELVNIIVNSFLTALNKELNCHLVSSVPMLTVDMFGSVISSLYMELGQYDDQVMILKNEFIYLGDKIDASLYFIPNEGVLEKLFKLLGL
ncbi:chemotaxis protein CheC [Vagococcus penaei]|uniref:Chemotaxis protein CheC n=1 Tax=Vagococcus penaei TaxID=633807 RepID=A0A1Q2D876_9ENTE|nr:chemotaxis protein CheC [Vagococcus penaei]AQP54584.1 chemotaxis protein CheC [Vagococcus penaei]RSU06704.1 chemotaxis protein CheC [Vagococcus penaei]